MSKTAVYFEVSFPFIEVEPRGDKKIDAFSDPPSVLRGWLAPGRRAGENLGRPLTRQEWLEYAAGGARRAIKIIDCCRCVSQCVCVVMEITTKGEYRHAGC